MLTLGGQDELGAAVVRVRLAGHVAVGFEVDHQFGHGLLGDLRPLGEHADRRPGLVEVLEHRTVCGADVPVSAFGEPDEDEVVERGVRLPHRHGQVGRPCAAGGDGTRS